MEKLSNEHYRMEHLNKVILQGRVGSVTTTVIGDKRLCKMAVMTTILLNDEEGPVVETSWFDVRYWGDKTPTAGDFIRVEGRLKSSVYVDSARNEHIAMHIFAQVLDILSTERKA